MDNVKHLNNFSNAINMFKIKLCKLFCFSKEFHQPPDEPPHTTGWRAQWGQPEISQSLINVVPASNSRCIPLWLACNQQTYASGEQTLVSCVQSTH